jgi:uncharacterized RDD family membrane protein YckC
MSIITIQTPFNIDLEFKLAAFPKRVVAWIIDMIIICVYYYIMMNFMMTTVGMHDAMSSVPGFLLVVLPVIVYQFAFEIFLNGQTLGKKAVGIKIIDKDGNEPSWGQYITRWLLCLGNLFVYAIPYAVNSAGPLAIFFFMVLYFPDVITILVSKKAQRIGDLAAGTVVIDAGYKTNISETIYQQIEVVDYVPRFPEVMRLTDRDINGIKNLLDIKNPGKDTERYVMQVEAKIKSVLQLQTEVYGTDFLQQLLFDYNFLAGK